MTTQRRTCLGQAPRPRSPAAADAVTGPTVRPRPAKCAWAGCMLAAWCSVAALGSPAMAAEVVNPHVVTDRSVDTSSVQAMVASLIRPTMTDRGRALAIYHYVRRTLFHYRYLPNCAGGGAINGACDCTGTVVQFSTV